MQAEDVCPTGCHLPIDIVAKCALALSKLLHVQKAFTEPWALPDGWLSKR